MSLLTINKSYKALKVGLGFLVYGVIPAAVVVSVFLLGRSSMLLLLAIPALAAVVWRWPHLTLGIILLSCMIVEGLYASVGVLPRQITWLSDVAILILVAKVVLTSATRFENINIRDQLRIPLLLLVAVFFSSTLLNKVYPITTLVAIRQYFKYVILYWAITRLPISPKYISRSFRFLNFLVLVQVPIILTGFILGFRGDMLYGGLGKAGTTPLVVMCVASASIFVSMYMHQGKVSSLIKLLIVSIIPAISEIKIGFIILPLSVIAVVFISISKNFKRAMVVISVLVVTVIGMTIIYNSIYPGVLQRLTSPSGLFAYMSHEEEASDSASNKISLGRLAQLQIAFSAVSKDSVIACVGLGPGETFDSYFEVAKGRWSTSLLGSASHNQFTLTLLELGFPGLLISIWVMVWLARGLAKLYMSTSVVKDKELTCGLFGFAITLIVCIFYMPVIFATDGTAYLFWASAAYLSLSINKLNKTSHLAKHKLFKETSSQD